MLLIALALSLTAASATTVGGLRSDDLMAFVADGPEAQPDPAATITVADTSGSFYWWAGNQGAWRADVTFTNDWSRHKFLTLVVTRVLVSGEVLDQHQQTFYVPGSGSSTFTVWNNDYRTAGRTPVGVAVVSVEVTHIDTYTLDWRPLSFDVDGPLATVEVPATP